ncbi:tetratricopeptide repeat protein [Halioxenophilus aromaticivorans]|uniref:Tetratricopeptide repeat protein n=2 Tax=Halioxenophilus aromaticivorans TaxID=1306992 RepID=A0AAV3U5Z7_9ALTE
MLKPLLAAIKRSAVVWSTACTAVAFTGLAFNSHAAIPAGGEDPVKPLTEVADLRYGVALYHYYQKDYFNALTELQMAEYQGGIQGHGVNPKIIEGGISLAFGMQTTAGHIFNTLLDSEQSAQAHNTAWFYLAKLAYMRGYWSDAQSYLDKLDPETMGQAMRDEAESIAINLLIRTENYSEAIERVDQLPKEFPNWGFLHYNLASAYGRQQRYEDAILYYEPVYDKPVTTASADPNVALALQDRARTAAGYSLLATGNYFRAYNTFNQVRLEGGQANQALLGSGWAAFNQNKLNQALAPWQELLRRDSVSPEVQEAQLAIPYAYEKLGAIGEALLAYSNAETAYEQELGRISEAREQLNSANLLEILGLTASGNSSWLEGVEPDTAGVINYLHKLIAQNQFQTQTQRLRDLQGMKDRLDSWQQKLDNYEELTQARVAFRIAQRENIEQLDYPAIMKALYEQQWQLQNEIDRISTQKDYLAFTEQAQKALTERAENALALSQELAEDIPAEQAEKAQLLYGLLYWQQAQNYHANLYQAQGNLATVNAEIKQMGEAYDRVRGLVDNADDLAPMAGRLAAMQSRVAGEQAQLDGTMSKLSDELTATLLTELNGQQARVNFFLAEARLAVARLYDGRALSPEDAPISDGISGEGEQ